MSSSKKIIFLKIAIFIITVICIAAIWFFLNPLYPTDEVLLIGATLYVFVITCVLLLFWRTAKPYEIKVFSDLFPHINESDIKRALRTREVWKTLDICWLSVYYFLNISALLLTVSVIYTAEYGTDNKRVILYSIISLCFTCACWLIRPKEQVQGYRKAFEILNSSLNEVLCKLSHACLKQKKC